MARPIDQDWEFLDRVIALALDIIDLANEIKETSDDPDILHLALRQESAALIIQKVGRDYRPRMRDLKKNKSVGHRP